MNDIEILIPEFDKNPKGFWWYAIALIVSITIAVIAYFLRNYTFIAIVGLFWVIAIIRDIRTPALIPLVITDLGISLGNKFWEYKNIKDFSIFLADSKSYLIFTPIGKFQLNVKVPIRNTEELRSKLTNSLTEVEYQEPLIEGLARILSI